MGRIRKAHVIAFSLTVFIVVVLVVLVGLPFSSKSGIDCGPDGKPVFNGTACISREPVYVEGP